MSDIRGKRNWLLGITQGCWQVLEGEKLNLTSVEMTEVVPASVLQEAVGLLSRVERQGPVLKVELAADIATFLNGSASAA